MVNINYVPNRGFIQILSVINGVNGSMSENKGG